MAMGRYAPWIHQYLHDCPSPHKCMGEHVIIALHHGAVVVLGVSLATVHSST